MAEGKSAPASGGTVIGAMVYDPRPFTPEQEARIAEIAAAVIASMQCRQQNRHLGLLSIAVTNPAFADRIQSVIDGKSAPEPRAKTLLGGE